ncbi:hypothetical protein HanRHA438_Chr17g0814711 [Helianthus annuus]|nr:hypothetical protein HanIR_Chr17g0872861 [Helianthus annuus]KAJ0826475.1 hypothetical protein HanRHA438_Chr17g0814711 [Helianthus annuus]
MKPSESVSMVFIIWLTSSSVVVEPRDFMTWMSSAPEILPSPLVSKRLKTFLMSSTLGK